MKRVKVAIFSIFIFLLIPQLCWAVTTRGRSLYGARSLPVVSTISPTTSSAGPQSIVLSGTNFINVTSVNIFNAVNGTIDGQAYSSCQYTVDSVSQITANVTLEAGSYYLRVTSPYGAAKSPTLTVTAPAPAAPTPAAPAPAAPKPLTLAPGPFKVEDLGSLVQTATLNSMYMYQLPTTKETHSFNVFVLNKYATNPFQIVDVNLANGQTRVVDGSLGRPGPAATIMHSNGKLYVGTGGPNYLVAYDAVAGQAQNLAKLADGGSQCIIEGDDGAVYIGEAPKGYVERYDPKDGTWENYGIIDDPGPPYYRYAYSLGADGRYVYIIVGTNPFYLVVYDRQTKTQTKFWKDQQISTCRVWKGWDGPWYACVTDANGVNRWYKFNGSNPPELQSGPPLYGTKFYPPYEVDLSKSTPDNSNGGLVTVRWREKSFSTWKETSAQVRIDPYPIMRLYADEENNKFFGFTPFYGPMFYYNPALKQTTILGRPQRSLYDALWWTSDTSEPRYFLAGYPSATMEWDPALPFNLGALSSNINDPTTNPHLQTLPPEGTGKYHFHLAKGPDGFVYVGEHHERDSDGGSLGWYDPVTGQKGGLRDPFLQYDVRDLLATKKGVIFSGIGIQTGIDGKLFLIDAKSKQVVSSIVPLPGQDDPGKLTMISDTVAVGVANKGNSAGKLYSVDLNSGSLLYVKDLPGSPFGDVQWYNQRLIKGPDGYVWFYLGNTVYRINPTFGSIEPIVDASPAGSLVFFHNDLYIYGRDTLRRVTGLFDQ
jgi:hypothetical protein